MSEHVISEMGVEDRPLPAPDPVTKPFWDATLRGELLVQQCPACGHRQYYPRAICTKCGEDPEWLTSKGEGTVHTFSIVRQTGSHPFNQWTPYTVAIVELDEGPRVLGNVVGVPVDEVEIGMRVRVEFRQVSDDAALPFWLPA